MKDHQQIDHLKSSENTEYLRDCSKRFHAALTKKKKQLKFQLIFKLIKKSP